ncbi:uncharacterized protein [Maniola hyperantus]|uniref:uncharacterized protein isoform X2 n=1 Tax=Aphantopus hyperantus TaxID=2795564 RepID=UPI003749C061
MNKDGTRCGAAGLRRSAIVERLRLREEWSALKEIPNDTESRQKPSTKAKKQHNTNTVPKAHKNTAVNKVISRNDKCKEVSEILRGIVVLVEVGSEPRALPLRAALSALGASVVPVWSPLVTHLVWTQGGCRSTRAKARVLGCSLVSPLWVEACAVEGRKLPERIFPAPTRPSDLPSPATLRRFLKKAEQENIPLQNLLNDSSEADKRPRLRLSSDTSRDTSHDTSKDTSHDATDDEPTAGRKNMQPSKITQQNRKDLAKAERMARLLLGTCKTIQTLRHTQHNKTPKIVLTGMSRRERHEAWQAIKQLNGKVQEHVDRKTTHVVMGSCHEPEHIITTNSPKTPGQSPKNSKNPLTMCNKCNSPGTILSQMFSTNVTVEDFSKKDKNDRHVVCHCDCDISGVKNLTDTSNNNLEFPIELQCNGINLDSNECAQNNGENREDILKNVVISKPRTVNALLGAARGCRVLGLDWVKDSLRANRWLPHIGYEVKHLKKICQKARVERSALNKMHTEYAYDVFNGMRVQISPDADQKDAITQLLTLCGAVIQNGDQPNVENNHKSGKNGAKIKFNNLLARIQNQNGRKNNQLTQIGRRVGTQNGRQIQDGGTLTADFDLTVGKGKGEVSSKWVFDSVAAARMRTTRRYIND